MPANRLSSSIVTKIVAAVRRDPQKAGILTVLLAILVVLQVRLYINDRDTNARATTASLTPTNSSTDGLSPSQSALANNSGSSNPVAQNGSARPADGATALRIWMDAPPVSIGRNLFTANLERFPQDGGRTTSANSKVSGFWDELAKSMSARADVKKERQILMENLAQQASLLRLQSTVMGPTPKAVINGDLVGEGDVVTSGTVGDTRVVFRVLKIEPRRILVEREGITLSIQMK